MYFKLWISTQLLILLTSVSFSQLTLLGHLDQKHGTTSGVSYNGCWGHVAPDGREYAILGTATGTAIIDITNTDSLYEVVHITGPTSLWREMRTYKERAYVVSEGGSGVQIINLEQLPDTAFLITNFNYSQGPKNIIRNHSIEIFDGYMYLNGSANWSPGGVLIFSLANPDLPTYVGEYQRAYAHDSYVKGNRLFSAAINSPGGLNIADISNKSNPVHITKITYSGAGTHNAWTTAGGDYVLTTDEIGSTPKTLKIWDVSSIPPAPSSPVATYTINPADIIHNVTVRGNYAYVAWYTAGIVVVDIENPASPSTAGWYDTSTEAPGSYNGVWAVYPYFWSGKVIAGDMQNGLYVFSFEQLSPRQNVQLQEPADESVMCEMAPITFTWTHATDSTEDPHQYWLTLKGPSLDTTYKLSSDTTFTLSDVGTLTNGTYQWWVTTVDEVTAVVSPDTFTFVYPVPALALLSPNGGEMWIAGTVHTISWSEQYIDSVLLEYSLDNGTTWQTIVDDTLANIGSYDWLLPDTSTNTALVRIRDLGRCGSEDISEMPFSILLPPTITTEASWNLLSIPVVPDTEAVNSNFPGAISPAYVYNRGYLQSDSIANGYGFWIKYTEESSFDVAGELLYTDTIDINENWNIIGSVSLPIAVADIQTLPDTNSVTGYFSYSAVNGYIAVDTIYPGKGYWVNASEDGQLILNGTTLAKRSRNTSTPPKELTSLTFEDRKGSQRTLYLTMQQLSDNEKALYKLPPSPPSGIFDARFSSGQFVESITPSKQSVIIRVRDVNFPVSITLQEADAQQLYYTLKETQSDDTHILSPGRSVVYTSIPSGELVLEVRSEQSMPKEFALYQNYPNPFNPETEVRYQIPEVSFVTLKVFNVLGEEVATLVNELRHAGNHTAKFDASTLPSGIYFYRMTAGKFTQTKKLALMK